MQAAFFYLIISLEEDFGSRDKSYLVRFFALKIFFTSFGFELYGTTAFLRFGIGARLGTIVRYFGHSFIILFLEFFIVPYSPSHIERSHLYNDHQYRACTMRVP